MDLVHRLSRRICSLPSLTIVSAAQFGTSFFYLIVTAVSSWQVDRAPRVSADPFLSLTTLPPTWKFAFAGFRPIWRWLAVAYLTGTAALAASGGGTVSFDLPADSAEKSLRRFSTESGQPILFPTEVTRGIRTAAVRGNYSPREALDRMLAGTPLR